MSDLIDREEAVALAIDHFSADVDDRASMVAALRALPAVAPWAEEELISALTRTELNRYHAERIARVVLSRPSPVREPDEAQPTAYCCHCGARPITDGSELACGCWTCSAKCWEAEVGPDDVPDCHSCPTTLASERRRAPDYEAGSRVLRDELYTQPNTHALARAIIDAAIKVDPVAPDYAAAAKVLRDRLVPLMRVEIATLRAKLDNVCEAGKERLSGGEHDALCPGNRLRKDPCTCGYEALDDAIAAASVAERVSQVTCGGL